MKIDVTIYFYINFLCKKYERKERKEEDREMVTMEGEIYIYII